MTFDLHLFSALVVTLICLTFEVFGMNEVSFLASELDIYSEDKISLRSSHIVNGSQIDAEIFPNPMVQVSNKFGLVHMLIAEIGGTRTHKTKCIKTVSNRPFHHDSLCSKNGTLIYNWILTPSFERKTDYSIDLANTFDEQIYGCFDIASFDEYIIAACASEGIKTQIALVQKMEKELKLIASISGVLDKFTGSLIDRLTITTSKTGDETLIIAVYIKGGVPPLHAGPRAINIFELNITNTSFRTIYSGEAWKESAYGISDLSIFSDKIFFAIDIRNQIPIKCILGSQLDCTVSSPLGFISPSLIISMIAKYDYKSLRTDMYIVNDRRLFICRELENVIVSQDQCTTILTSFIPAQIQNLESPYMVLDRSNLKVSVAYRSRGIQEELGIGGVLIFNIPQQSSSFVDLSFFLGAELSVLSSEFFVTLESGTITNLNKVSDPSIMISPSIPLSTDCYLTITPNNEALSSYIYPFILNRLESEMSILKNVDNVVKMTVFKESENLHFVGIGGLAQVGNLLQIDALQVNITKDDDTQILGSVTVEDITTEIEFRGIDGSSLSDLHYVEPGYFVGIEMTDSSLIHIFKVKYEKKLNATILLNTFTIRLGSQPQPLKIVYFKSSILILAKEPTNAITLTQISTTSQTVLSVFELTMNNSIANIKIYSESIFVAFSQLDDLSDPFLYISEFHISDDEELMSVLNYTLNSNDELGTALNPVYLRFSNSIKRLYILDFQEDTVSLIKVSLEDLSQDILPTMIEREVVVDNEDDITGFNFCSTEDSLLILQKKKNIFYGATLDLPGLSFIHIPIDTDVYNIQSLECPILGGFLTQAIIQNKETEEYEILNILNFDGTNSLRKLHSKYKLPPKTQLKRSFGFGKKPKILSILRNEESNEYYGILVEIHSPKIMISPNNFTEGMYNIKATISNGVTSSIVRSVLNVESYPGVVPNYKELVSLPETLSKAQQNITEYFSWKGAILSIELEDKSLSSSILLTQRLQQYYSTHLRLSGESVVKIKEDIVLTIGDDKTTLKVYLEGVILRAKISLDKYGDNCYQFKIQIIRKTIEILFVCNKRSSSELVILSLERSEKKVELLYQGRTPFHVRTISAKSFSPYLYYVLKEESGQRLGIFRYDRNTKLGRSYIINTKLVGDLNLNEPMIYDYTVSCNIMALAFSVKGSTNTHIVSFDFKSSSQLQNIRFSMDDVGPIRFIGLQRSDGDQCTSTLIFGGYGIEFKSIDLSIDPLDGKMIIEDGVRHTYYLPLLRNSHIDSIQMKGAYFRLKGSFELMRDGMNFTFSSIIYKQGEPYLFAAGKPDSNRHIEGLTHLDNQLKYYYLNRTSNVITYFHITEFTIQVINSEKLDSEKTDEGASIGLILNGAFNSTQISFYLTKGNRSQSVLFPLTGVIILVLLLIIIGTYSLATASHKSQLDAISRLSLEKFGGHVKNEEDEEESRRATDNIILDKYFNEFPKVVQRRMSIEKMMNIRNSLSAKKFKGDTDSYGIDSNLENANFKKKKGIKRVTSLNTGLARKLDLENTKDIPIRRSNSIFKMDPINELYDNEMEDQDIFWE